MTSSAVVSGSPFEEARISPAVSVEHSSAFFQEHGIFYHGDDEIGRLVEELDSKSRGRDDMDLFKPIFSKDPVSV